MLKRRLFLLVLAASCSRKGSTDDRTANATPPHQLVEPTQASDARAAESEVVAPVASLPAATPTKGRNAALPCAKAFKQLSEERPWHTSKNKDPNLLVSVQDAVNVALDAGAKLTLAERELVAVYWFDNETRNGGLLQYFQNSSGDTAVRARDGLARFGMTQSRDVLNCALTAFPKSTPSKDSDDRWDELAAWGDNKSDILRVLTSAYYVVADEESDHLDAYVRAHRDEFPSAASVLRSAR